MHIVHSDCIIFAHLGGQPPTIVLTTTQHSFFTHLSSIGLTRFKRTGDDWKNDRLGGELQAERNSGGSALY